MQVVADYCGYLLACYFDVVHPDMRVVAIGSEEGGAIKTALERLDRAKPLSPRSWWKVPNVPSALLLDRALSSASLASLGPLKARPTIGIPTFNDQAAFVAADRRGARWRALRTRDELRARPQPQGPRHRRPL